MAVFIRINIKLEKAERTRALKNIKFNKILEIKHSMYFNKIPF
jgi:hypothetical protein